jgi:PAS domain-containing protein
MDLKRPEMSEGAASNDDMTAVFAAALRATGSEKEHLARLNRWLEVALNNMARGLSMFDAQQRLILCNKVYREIYSLPEDLTRPGTPLADIVRYHVKRNRARRRGHRTAAPVDCPTRIRTGTGQDL